MKERSKEQIPYQQMVECRGGTWTSHALVDREKDLQRFTGVKTLSMHSGC